MRLEIDIAEHHYNNIMALDSVSLGRVPYKGIIMYSINAIKHGKILGQDSSTKVNQDFNQDLTKNKSEIPTSSTTKNDLGGDCISRAEAIKCLECNFDITGKENMKTVVNYINSAHDKIVNLPRVKQEPFKPMVEIDLDYVIKQKYIEREVLDKIRAEIETKYGHCDICEYFEDYDYEENDISEYRPIGNIADILLMIDKYKAETEET